MINEVITNTTTTAVSLQPGRELDKLIAQKVMGWKRAEQKAIVAIEGGGEIEKRLVWRVPDNHMHLAVEDKIPHYSTDITAAWQVWEKLPKPRRLHETELGGFVVMCGGRSYAPDSNFIHDAIAMGGTAAHAICLAALKSVEE